jgi:SAM-dependent methyltransferase
VTAGVRGWGWAADWRRATGAAGLPPSAAAVRRGDAGLRDIYYDNVVNYEIVDYDTTDVIGPGERLPFRDGVFDAVISIAVLEHVRDPFACAAEIVRVLKPGGELVCSVPFLQPLHGYPHHYYNMTPQGLRALFERSLLIPTRVKTDSPTGVKVVRYQRHGRSPESQSLRGRVL